MAYAVNTTVPIDKTRCEIESMLRKYGADQFSYGVDDSRGMAVIRFRSNERQIQFVLTLPSVTDYAKTPSGLDRSVAQAEALWKTGCRSHWRALMLCIKGKLESVESGIEVFEEAFLPHIMLPDGKTAGEWLRPQIAIAYKTERMPKDFLMLPAPEKH